MPVVPAFDARCGLWPDQGEQFFRDRTLGPVRQVGPRCVSTCLAILTGAAPQEFQGRVNTQDPVSWSAALRGYGMKLAFCPTDARKLRFYMDELLRLDDLFTLSYYKPKSGPQGILADPDEEGWVCGSHVVVLHRGTVLDPASGLAMPAGEHPCNEFHTKRVFRVVPASHARGL